MIAENKKQLLALLDRHRELGILAQIDYEKFYLYSIITHSTAIEGSAISSMILSFMSSRSVKKGQTRRA